VELEDRDVVLLVVADDRGLVGPAVSHVGDADRRGAADDVVVRQHLARGGEHHAGAGGLGVLVPDGRVDVDEGRTDPAGDARGVRRAAAGRHRCSVVGLDRADGHRLDTVTGGRRGRVRGQELVCGEAAGHCPGEDERGGGGQTTRGV
jgi:hypothetical protein